jgi:hypothetical protein
MRKLTVTFDEPGHGWSRLQLHSDEAQLSEPFSHIYPTLRELCGALCDLLTGHTSRPVVFLLEPAELELTLTPLDDAMTRLRLRMFESRLRTSDVDAVFEFQGEATEIALAFWRALRRLQTDLPEADFEKGWREPFPALEMLR